jgi:hypothetical protein
LLLLLIGTNYYLLDQLRKILMYEWGKLRHVETIPGIVRGKDKGE